jgi:hypothetical protein
MQGMRLKFATIKEERKGTGETPCLFYFWVQVDF